MMTSIVIPTYNGFRLLAECIQAIRAFTFAPYEIIVVDNGSTDGTLDYCRKESLTLLSLPTNLGFPAACNLGLKLASGDQLLLLNNDVVVTHYWLDHLLACLHSADDIGIVGPTTNYVSGKQQVEPFYQDLNQLHELSLERCTADSSKWLDCRRIVGLCFLFKRELMDRIGFLDEQFSPGHYEDDDYCHRARLANYRLVIAGDAYVHHHGSASFRQSDFSLESLIAVNLHKFMVKWGFDPRIHI